MNIPACAITIDRPSAFINELLPQEFVPNKSIPSCPLPKHISFVIYSYLSLISSIIGCLNSVTFTNDLSDLTIDGL